MRFRPTAMRKAWKSFGRGCRIDTSAFVEKVKRQSYGLPVAEEPEMALYLIASTTSGCPTLTLEELRERARPAGP